MKKTYLKPMVSLIMVKNTMLLSESVSFSIDTVSEGNADQAASRGGSFWDDVND